MNGEVGGVGFDGEWGMVEGGKETAVTFNLRQRIVVSLLELRTTYGSRQHLVIVDVS